MSQAEERCSMRKNAIEECWLYFFKRNLIYIQIYTQYRDDRIAA